MNLKNVFLKKFGNNLSESTSLSNYSWFNLGGNAEFFFKPNDSDQLIEFLAEAKNNNLKITILGAGSNTLIRDKGVRGVVIKLSSNFSLDLDPVPLYEHFLHDEAPRNASFLQNSLFLAREQFSDCPSFFACWNFQKVVRRFVDVLGGVFPYS